MTKGDMVILVKDLKLDFAARSIPKGSVGIIHSLEHGLAIVKFDNFLYTVYVGLDKLYA